MSSTRAGLGCALFVLASSVGHAAEQSDFGTASGARYRELVIAPFAVHWKSKSGRENAFMLGLEGGEYDGPLWGASVFRNSYGDPSAYGFVGYRYDGLLGQPALFVKLTAGLLYGYKDKYAKKVPFYSDGWGLAIIPLIGYRLTSLDSLQFGLLGTDAAFFTYSRRF